LLVSLFYCLLIRACYSYPYIVERQPIGKLLFREFCESTNHQYFQACLFLNKVEEYETSDDDGKCRRELARSIVCLLAPSSDTPSSSQCCYDQWCSFLPEKTLSSIIAAADSAAQDEEPRTDIFAEAYKYVLRRIFRQNDEWSLIVTDQGRAPTSHGTSNRHLCTGWVKIMTTARADAHNEFFLRS
uniref:RGS domain-containing protein n=1 Tax=Haemonchus placei TaxID=6290 RepID=A0A0N4WIK8_HAEPC